jgi:hypothetical protein
MEKPSLEIDAVLLLAPDVVVTSVRFKGAVN